MIKKRLDVVTIFRFITAFYVFIFHAYIRIPVDAPPIIKQIMYNGATGMTFFFVLSGFILAYNYDSKVSSDYYKKRLLRIYPAYLFCGFLTLPQLIASSTFDGNGILKVISILFLYLTTTQGWIYSSFSSWNFGGTWSISVEMFFYAVFPLLISVANGNKFKYMAIISLASAALIMPIALVFNPSVDHIVFYSSPVFRLPEFAMGIVAAKLMQRGLRANLSSFLIAVSLLSYALSLEDYGWMQHDIIVVPAICVILIYVSGLNVTPQSKRYLAPLIFMGDISYSFYLMQLVLFVYLDNIHPSFIYNNGYLGWIMVFAVTLPLSIFSFYVFERKIPIHIMNRKVRSYRP